MLRRVWAGEGRWGCEEMTVEEWPALSEFVGAGPRFPLVPLPPPLTGAHALFHLRFQPIADHRDPPAELFPNSSLARRPYVRSALPDHTTEARRSDVR